MYKTNRNVFKVTWDNIKMGIKEIGLEGVGRIHSERYRDKWQAK